MSNRVAPIASYRGSDSAVDRPGWTLALSFQEVFTAVVRLRDGGQAVPDADVFRAHIIEALRSAEQDARSRGSSAEDVKQALFAIVAYVDESVLNSRNPVFADWPRRPLQEELFGGHIAGELFFQNMQQLLNRQDSHQTSDLLEVYCLCILLGYRGRFGASGGGASGELVYLLNNAQEKINRMRGNSCDLSPHWVLPPQPPHPAARDEWVRRLAWVAVACAVLVILLFAGFEMSLLSGASQISTMTTRTPN